VPDFTELQIAQLIAALPPAPEAWVSAAQQRQVILHDLEAALKGQGVEPRDELVHELCARLRETGGQDA
jgi:hypothetical protein